MNLSTILISLALITLFALAIRFLARNGACAACPDKGACHSANADDGGAAPTGCSGNCAACRYCPSKAANLQKGSEGFHLS